MAGKSCGGCTDCGCSDTPETQKAGRSYGNPHPNRDDWSFFKQPPPEGPTPDPTPLSERCPHYEFGAATRAQCKECIVSWVVAVGYQEASETAERFVAQRRFVAANRIKQAIADHLSAERFGTDCDCP